MRYDPPDHANSESASTDESTDSDSNEAPQNYDYMAQSETGEETSSDTDDLAQAEAQVLAAILSSDEESAPGRNCRPGNIGFVYGA